MTTLLPFKALLESKCRITRAALRISAKVDIQGSRGSCVDDKDGFWGKSGSGFAKNGSVFGKNGSEFGRFGSEFDQNGSEFLISCPFVLFRG
jgi:hypothetical protein